MIQIHLLLEVVKIYSLFFEIAQKIELTKIDKFFKVILFSQKLKKKNGNYERKNMFEK